MTIGIAQAAVNLGSAVTLGAVIGFERQWRQRLAGLRTNTLVALGAASFVVSRICSRLKGILLGSRLKSSRESDFSARASFSARV